MKTVAQKGDGILWFLLAASFMVFAATMAKAQTVAKDVIKVKISGNGYSDETFIRFKEGASAGFENDKDAWKMFSLNGNVPMIYSKVSGCAVSLNTQPSIDKKTAIDLFTRINVPGTYSIEAKIVSPFDDTIKIFLIDPVTNEIYNVRTDSSISLNLAADSGNAVRFQLYFSTPAKFTPADLTCFRNKDGKIAIKNLSDKGWQIEMTDENNVVHQLVNGTDESYTFSALHGGNYYISITDFTGQENHWTKVDQPMPVLSSFEMTGATVCLCEGGVVNFANNSVGADNFTWNYGDGAVSKEFQAEHSYSSTGNYIVSLTVSDGQCSDTSFAQVHVIENFSLAISEIGIKEEGTLFYDGESYVFKAKNSIQNARVEVFSMLGQKIQAEVSHTTANEMRIDVSENGFQPYLFHFTIEGKVFSRLGY